MKKFINPEQVPGKCCMGENRKICLKPSVARITTIERGPDGDVELYESVHEICLDHLLRTTGTTSIEDAIRVEERRKHPRVLSVCVEQVVFSTSEPMN
jgi:hypothetical protein